MFPSPHFTIGNGNMTSHKGHILEDAELLYILLLYYSNKLSESLENRILFEAGEGVAEPGPASRADPAVDVQHLPDAAAALPRPGTPCSSRALPNPKCRAGCSQQSPTKPCANQQHMEEFSPHSPQLSFGLAGEFGTSRALKGVWELCFLRQLGKKPLIIISLKLLFQNLFSFLKQSHNDPANTLNANIFNTKWFLEQTINFKTSW